MRKLISIAASGLGLCWLIGQIMFQLFVVETPRPAFYWLNAGNALQIVAALLAIALLLVTNTRRPRGIDPDGPLGPTLGLDQATLDAFSLTTDEVLKHERKRVSPDQIAHTDEPKERPRRNIVIDESGEPYGRRSTDISIADIKRTIEAVHQIREAGGIPEEIINVPEWAKTLLAEREGNGAADDTSGPSNRLDLQPISTPQREPINTEDG
jgi:hypothetical protein